jgi:hypothetical protein
MPQLDQNGRANVPVFLRRVRAYFRDSHQRPAANTPAITSPRTLVHVGTSAPTMVTAQP